MLGVKSQWHFAALVAAGFALFLAAPITIRHSFCPPDQPNIGTVQRNESSANYEYRAYEVYLETQKDDTKPKQNTAAKTNKDNLPPKWVAIVGFCGETKTSDFALVFFTYILAIVGWFTLRSNEKNLESLERARMFHGYSPLRFRSDQARFTLRMVNVGKMPARVTEVGWKFLARTTLPPTRKERDWIWQTIPYDFVITPQGRPDIKTFLSLKGDHIFVSYIAYEDLLTRKRHESWMGMRIRPNEPETRAGGDAWNEWT